MLLICKILIMFFVFFTISIMSNFNKTLTMGLLLIDLIIGILSMEEYTDDCIYLPQIRCYRSTPGVL